LLSSPCDANLARLVDHAGGAALGAAGVLGRLLGVPGLLPEPTRGVAALRGGQVQRLEHLICLEDGGGGRWVDGGGGLLELVVVEEVLFVGQQASRVELLGHLVQVGVLAGPVVAEPGGGGDEVPPLRREVLHLQQRRRDEERRVRVQRRRRRDRHGAHGSPCGSWRDESDVAGGAAEDLGDGREGGGDENEISE